MAMAWAQFPKLKSAPLKLYESILDPKASVPKID